MSIAVSELERPTLTVGEFNRSENLGRAKLRPVPASRQHPAFRLGTQKAPNVALHEFEVAPISTVESMDQDSSCLRDQCLENRLAPLPRDAQCRAKATSEVDSIRSGGAWIVENLDVCT